jgi:hypothetical protein
MAVLDTPSAAAPDKENELAGHLRPISTIDPPYAMLRCGPSDRPFAETAKSVDGRTHSSRD